MLTEVRRTVRKKIFAERFRRNVARPNVGAPVGRQALLVAGRRQDTEKIDLSIRGDEIAGAVLANTEINILARPMLLELARESGCTVALGSRDGLNMIYIEYARGEAAVFRNVSVGIYNDDVYEVLSGLQEGETVVLNRSGADSRFRNPNQGRGGLIPRGMGGGGRRGR